MHTNQNVSNGQKLQYIPSPLKNNALKVVKPISISDDNYQITWSLLEQRFSNHRE